MAKVNKQRNSDMENLICNQYGERLAILNTKIIKICGLITKAIKNAICLYFLPHLQVSQGSVATCPRWAG